MTREQLEERFDRTNAELIADAAELRRKAAWPGLVDQLLDRLVRRSTEDRSALAAIDARLTALETAMGIQPG